MIKTLLNADEEPPPGTKVVVEETVLTPPAPPAEPQAATAETVPENTAENTAASESFEIPEDAKFFSEPSENAGETAARNAAETPPLDEDAESLSALMEKIENLEPEEFDRLEREIGNAPAAEPPTEIPAAPQTASQIESPSNAAENAAENEAEKKVFETPEGQTAEAPYLFDNSGSPVFTEETAEKRFDDAPVQTIFQSDYTPPTTAETIRNSGLAWSAGIVFFGAVIFMMIFGWFADLLFGSSPWGLVGGIILGGIIGFIQFFRITSQIFKK